MATNMSEVLDVVGPENLRLACQQMAETIRGPLRCRARVRHFEKKNIRRVIGCARCMALSSVRRRSAPLAVAAGAQSCT